MPRSGRSTARLGPSGEPSHAGSGGSSRRARGRARSSRADSRSSSSSGGGSGFRFPLHLSRFVALDGEQRRLVPALLPTRDSGRPIDRVRGGQARVRRMRASKDAGPASLNSVRLRSSPRAHWGASVAFGLPAGVLAAGPVETSLLLWRARRPRSVRAARGGLRMDQGEGAHAPLRREARLPDRNLAQRGP
jgi:hypothetical protein